MKLLSTTLLAIILVAVSVGSDLHTAQPHQPYKQLIDKSTQTTPMNRQDLISAQQKIARLEGEVERLKTHRLFWIAMTSFWIAYPFTMAIILSSNFTVHDKP